MLGVEALVVFQNLWVEAEKGYRQKLSAEDGRYFGGGGGYGCSCPPESTGEGGRCTFGEQALGGGLCLSAQIY